MQSLKLLFLLIAAAVRNLFADMRKIFYWNDTAFDTESFDTKPEQSDLKLDHFTISPEICILIRPCTQGAI